MDVDPIDDLRSPRLNEPGRICPLRYRYGAAAIARAPTRDVETLYVVGGLYGNVPALDAVESLARAEPRPATLCFNGDFNWFDVADDAFVEINRRVLAHDAILGNVEAELEAPDDDAGCGCAYPDTVDAGTVERSNRIHALLKITAARHPQLLRVIARLPMFARYVVGDCRVGVVHGDADALAGWRFDAGALRNGHDDGWLRTAFDAASVDVFASTHTCLPILHRTHAKNSLPRCVVNNGAAGMPNFAGDLSGLCTRIATRPSPHPVVREVRIGDAWLALLRVRYDTPRWHESFFAQWPHGSPARLSYADRILQGPGYAVEQAFVDAG